MAKRYFPEVGDRVEIVQAPYDWSKDDPIAGPYVGREGVVVNTEYHRISNFGIDVLFEGETSSKPFHVAEIKKVDA